MESPPNAWFKVILAATTVVVIKTASIRIIITGHESKVIAAIIRTIKYYRDMASVKATVVCYECRLL